MSQAIANEDSDLILAATAIFGGTKNQFTLKSGKEVVIRPAGMKETSLIVRFFQTLMNNIDPELIGGLVELIAERQKAAIIAGQDPNNIDMAALSGVELVTRTLEKANLLMEVMAVSMEQLPGLAPIFTNLTLDEYEALELDEGLLVAGGIFMLNYSFFTQKLPPLFKVFMKSWVSKNPAVLDMAKAALKSPVKRRTK